MSQSKEELLVSLQQKYDFVSMSDLERPTSEFMMRYFCTVLSNLGIDTQELMQPKNLQNADMLKEYKDIFPYLQLRMIILQVFPIPEYIHHLSVLSLMDPKPSDIQFVAVMDNYSEYFDRVTCDLLAPNLSRIADIKEEIQQLEKERAALKTHLSDWDAVRGRRAIAQVKLDEQMIELSGAEVRLTEQLQQLEAEDADQRQQQEELQREWQELEELEAKYETQRQYDLLCKQVLQLQAKQQELERVLNEKRDLRQEKKSLLHLVEKRREEMSETIRETEDVLATDIAIKEMDAALQQDLLKKESLQKELLISERDEAVEDLTVALDETATIENSITAAKQKKADIDKSIEDFRLIQLKANQELNHLQEKIKSATSMLSNKNRSAVNERNNFQKSLQELYEKLFYEHNRLKIKLSGEEK